MMAPQHALTGAVAWSVVVATQQLSATVLLAGYVVCAGAALWPDIDHPGSTVSRCLGFGTGALSWVICKLTGGHRRGTHSLFGVAVFTGCVWLSVEMRPEWYGIVPTALMLFITLTALCKL